MRTPMSEIVDLALTQAIERYQEMNIDEVSEAISKEWPEQIAMLLDELFFKSTCGPCSGMPDFIAVERENGTGDYVIPMCSCDGWQE